MSADAFARVGAALLAVWPTVASGNEGLTRAEFGRLLDECGSDHRPLAELLLELGRVVRPALTSLAPQPHEAWLQVRAPLVHRIVSTRYLQPDVARWAVDVWGRALGVAPALSVTSPALVSGDAADDRVSAASAESPGPGALGAPRAPGHRGAVPARALPAPPVLAPQQVPAALRQRPSWAGGPVSFGVGQRPSAAGLAALAQSGRVVVRAPVPPGPMFQPAERRAAAILGALLVIITAGLMRSFGQRPTVTTPVDAIGANGVAVAPATDSGSSALGVTVNDVASDGTEADGLPADARPPARVATATAPLAGPRLDPPVADTLAVRDAGVGGTYVVQQRVRDVSGSTSCDAVAQALAAGRESQEVVSHAPGTATFTLVTRGVTGTLDADGQFVSEPRAGTTNNVNWRFFMRGRFGPDGFTGESVTHTDAILRWGRMQSCVVTADLTARRLP